MSLAPVLVELHRGGHLESVHRGHAVICDAKGEIVEAWGDPDALIFPRSACKMVQALPLVEAGLTLTSEQLALACASHEAAPIHTSRVAQWLEDLGLEDNDFRCGPQMPRDRGEKVRLIKADESPCRIHNNCSGKHAGFLTLTRHLDAGPDYVALDHPVQQMVRDAFEDVTGMSSPGYGVDGCSAPNFLTSVHGLARAMAFFAAAQTRATVRSKAAAQLTEAMMAHPDLVAGEGRACTELMRAMEGKVAIKTGAEGVFVAIVPERQLGIAVKMADGATRAAEGAIVGLLSRVGALDPSHPAALKRLGGPILNWDGLEVGRTVAADALRA